MLQVLRGPDRGQTRLDWLDSRHSFSFGDYYDPAHMGFRALRVINEDWVAPGQGFGTHPHRDMEIVTYVLEGELKHRDSMGHGETLRPGEFQHMTAGTGIRHSEFNPSPSTPVHLYQIWLMPRERGLTPGYSQKAFAAEERHGKFRVVASPDGRDGSLTIQQDARILLATLDAGT
ncbi:MAG: pirin family protein, partial [Gemmataceae bacterium]